MSKIFFDFDKDTSIYENEPNLNAGADEILDVGKDQPRITDNVGAVRTLMEVDLTDLKGAPTNSSAILDLKVANAENLNQDEFIYVYAVSRSWTEGSGYYNQTPFNSTDGATWRRHTTASFWSNSGSDFTTTPVVSASVGDLSPDNLLIDVSSIIQPIMSGSSSNFGILLKFSDNSEDDINNKGIIRFFSRNTHTVHTPRLILSWDAQSFITGSLKAIPDSNVQISPRNLKQSYTQGEKQKIYFTVRDRFPLKSFTNTTRFDNQYYLPIESTYSITDVGAGTTIVKDDEFSKLDCDATGSNIILDTTSLFKGRFYDLRVKASSSSETFFSETFRFSIK